MPAEINRNNLESLLSLLPSAPPKREPSTWRDWLSNLVPAFGSSSMSKSYCGPFKVGVFDVELPYNNGKEHDLEPAELLPVSGRSGGAKTPSNSVEMQATSTSATPVTKPAGSTLLFRIYYPCNVSTDAAAAGTAPWLPHHLYAWGYGHFLRFSKALSYTLFWPLSNFVRKPAILNAPFLTPPSSNGKYPVVIFSHGLGGNRTTYSQFCGDLASWGHVVLALEHSDGSASITGRFNHSYAIRYKHAQSGWTQDRIWHWRHEQLRYRVEEVKELLRVVRKLDNGEVIDNIMKAGESGNSVQEVPSKEFTLKSLHNCIDTSRTLLAGHSFGGCTLLETVYQLSLNDNNHLLPSISGIVAMDPWMYPLSKTLQIPSSLPILFTNSHKFLWKENLDAMERLVEGRNKKFNAIKSGLETTVDSKFNGTDEKSGTSISTMLPSRQYFTIPGTAHQDYSDLPLLFPTAMRAMGLSGTNGNPATSLLVHNAAVLSWIGMTFPKWNLHGAKDVWSTLVKNEFIEIGMDEPRKRLQAVMSKKGKDTKDELDEVDSEDEEVKEERVNDEGERL